MVGMGTDALAWTLVLGFAITAYLEEQRPATANYVGAGTWVGFGVFWGLLIPHFAVEQRSIIEGVLCLLAVPACVHAAWLRYHGRNTLTRLETAIAIMGFLYLPFQAIPAITVAGVHLPAPKEILIEIVAQQTAILVTVFGYSPDFIVGGAGYLNTFQAITTSGQTLQFSIVLACTGIGSISIFAGLIGAADAPGRRKLKALGVSATVVYMLNLARTTFISIVFTQQLMQWHVPVVQTLFGTTDPYLVSYLWADRIIGQSLSVLALVGVTYLVIQVLPETLTVLEEAFVVVTGREVNLSSLVSTRHSP